jgi:hypothetical protein
MVQAIKKEKIKHKEKQRLFMQDMEHRKCT